MECYFEIKFRIVILCIFDCGILVLFCFYFFTIVVRMSSCVCNLFFLIFVLLYWYVEVRRDIERDVVYLFFVTYGLFNGEDEIRIAIGVEVRSKIDTFLL